MTDQTDQAGAHTPDLVQMAHDIRFYFEASPDVLDVPNEETGTTLYDDVLTLTDAVIEGRLIANTPAMAEELTRLRTLNAQLLEALKAMTPPTLCGESWNLADTETVEDTTKISNIKLARAALSQSGEG